MRVGLVLAPRVEGVRVSWELRGWSLLTLLGGLKDSVLVRPSELAAPCPVRRDVWLMRNGVRLAGGSVSRGVNYHREILSVFRAAVSGGWGGLKNVVEGGVIRSHAGAWALAVVTAWLSSGQVPPIAVEPYLPPVLGFTRSKPDLVVGSAPAEVAYSPAGLSGKYADAKRVELATYALILEALIKLPVNYGWLIMVGDKRVSTECVVVDDVLREEALRAREDVARVASSLTPPQPNPESCPATCPFRESCLGTAPATEGLGEVVRA